MGAGNMDRVTSGDRLRMFAHDPDTFEFDASDAASLVAEIDELMLPAEPTDGMIEAGEEEIAARYQFGGRIFAADIWAAMVRAYRDGLFT